MAIGVLGVFKAGAVFSSFSGIGESPDGVPGVDISVWFTLPGSFLGALALARLRSTLIISFLRALALARLRSTLIIVKAEVAILITTV